MHKCRFTIESRYSPNLAFRGFLVLWTVECFLLYKCGHSECELNAAFFYLT